MKRNFLKSGVLALLIVLSGAAFGNTAVNDKDSVGVKTEESSSLEVAIYARDHGYVAVNFRKKLDEIVEVKILSYDGEQIFKEKISKNELIRRSYNMKDLPDGYYYFEVSNDNYLVRQLVDKKN